MSRLVFEYAPAGERPGFLTLMGWLGLLGCATLIAGTLIAPFYVPGHDWVADTISDLAAGHSEIIMDLALYGFAAGLLALALAAAHAHLGEGLWSLGTLSLAILAAVVVVIGARNEYGDGDTDGVVIHIYLVYALGLLFAAVPFSMAWALGYEHPWAKTTLLGLGTLWLLAAPIFFVLPTGIDGLYERALGLIACAICLVLALVFIDRGRT